MFYVTRVVRTAERWFVASLAFTGCVPAAFWTRILFDIRHRTHSSSRWYLPFAALIIAAPAFRNCIVAVSRGAKNRLRTAAVRRYRAPRLRARHLNTARFRMFIRARIYKTFAADLARAYASFAYVTPLHHKPRARHIPNALWTTPLRARTAPRLRTRQNRARHAYHKPHSATAWRCGNA